MCTIKYFQITFSHFLIKLTKRSYIISLNTQTNSIRKNTELKIPSQQEYFKTITFSFDYESIQEAICTDRSNVFSEIFKLAISFCDKIILRGLFKMHNEGTFNTACLLMSQQGL